MEPASQPCQRLVACSPLQALEDAHPALRFADLVDEEVLLLDDEQRVVKLQGLGELILSGLPGARVPGLDAVVAYHAAGDFSLESETIAEMQRKPAQEAIGSLERYERLSDDAVYSRRAKVADFVVVVAEGIVEGQKGRQVLFGCTSWSGRGEECAK